MTNKLSNERGFSLTELIVVIGLIGLLSLVAVPSLLTYWRTSSLTAGTEQLAAVMNRARQLAVSQNTSVCVERTGTNVRLRMGSCAGTIWGAAIGSWGPAIGADSAGNIQIANNLQVTGGTTALFTNAGGASANTTYTLTDPKTSRSRTVVVSTSGRVIIQ